MFEHPIIQLPPQLTSFIGRGDEIIQIGQQLDNPDCHLLTLVGPGGIGKTRLAIEVATNKSFPDGIYFVDLQPVSAVDLLVTTIANSMDMRFFGEQPPRVQLLNFLRDRNLLLLIDNFEHLLNGVDLLTEIVKAAPNVKILVTSREALNVQEEWLWQVQGLQVPEISHVGSINNFSAVRLFVERARRVRADFKLDKQENPVIRICKLVEGMPLALELAASWTKALSCDEIANELQRGIDFLTTSVRNVPERHRSMQAVFDQSWRMLTDEERTVFPTLSVFRGGFRREAAEAVAGASLQTLAGLVDKSFLRVSESGRYTIHELTRQYGERMLDTQVGFKAEIQDRHCDYYAEFMDNRRIELKGPQQIAALNYLQDEFDNVITSWRWAVTHIKELQIEQLVHTVVLYFQMRSQVVEGAQMFKWASEQIKDLDRPFVSSLLIAWNYLARHHQPIEFARLQKAFSLLTVQGISEETAFTLGGLWFTTEIARTETQKLYERCLEHFRTQDKKWGTALCLSRLGHFSIMNADEAERYIRESIRLFNLLGDQWAKTFSLGALGRLKEKTGAYQEALNCYEERLVICQDIGDTNGVIWSLTQIASAAVLSGNYEIARKHLNLGIHMLLATPSSDETDQGIKWLLNVTGRLAMQEGKVTQVVQICARVREYNRTLKGREKSTERINGILEHLALLLSPEKYEEAVKYGESREMKAFLREFLGMFSPSQPLREHPFHESYRVPLTERELEILRLVADGLQNQEIADQLFITLGTVKAHINAIYRKLDVANRVQAVSRAREMGLL